MKNIITKEQIAEFFGIQRDLICRLTIFGKLILCNLGGLLMVAALLFTYYTFPVEHIRHGITIAWALGYLFMLFYMNFVLFMCKLNGSLVKYFI